MIKSEHFEDDQGRPAGGMTEGVGFAVYWQNGPIGANGRNGAFVEDVIEAAIDRLEYHQRGPFACDANVVALANLRSSLIALHRRTQDRIARAVEGTYQP